MEGSIMTTTTGYGSWLNHAGWETTVEATIATSLQEWADDYDVDAMAAEYRRMINDALPLHVTLSGNEFIGPYYAADCDFDGYPVTEDGELDIPAILAEVDGTDYENFWALAERHNRTA